MDRERNNRRIAEWLEPRPADVEYGPLYSPTGAWERTPKLFKWQPRDFYADEAASAVLLEAMPAPKVERWSDGWYVYPDHHNEAIAWLQEADRKTAVATAMLAFIDAQEKRK